MQTAGRCTVSPKRNPYGGLSNGIMVSRDDTRVDCRICLYHMGHYMPLVKLDEHQRRNRELYNFQIEFFNED
jgi:hypothetical protein